MRNSEKILFIAFHMKQPNVSVLREEVTDYLMRIDIPYIPGEDPPHPGQTLDMYGDEAGSKKPVIIYIHGGGWQSGDKKLFLHLGETLAAQGLLAVVINYRHAPEVKFPDFSEDCAAAFAWVYKSCSEMGGDPDNIFLCGHSSGAHLAALLAADSRYLAYHDLSPENIAGVIAISGVYQLNPAESGGIEELKYPYTARNTVFQSMIDLAFGTDPYILDEASPVNYPISAAIPHLILHGEKENRYIKQQAQLLLSALRRENNPAELVIIPAVDHVSIVTDIWTRLSSTNRVIADFIEFHTRRSV